MLGPNTFMGYKVRATGKSEQPNISNVFNTLLWLCLAKNILEAPPKIINALSKALTVSNCRQKHAKYNLANDDIFGDV